MDIYLEIGQKRIFAGALDWPGWCRSGRSEDAALEALAAYGARYGRVMNAASMVFTPPAGPDGLVIVERLAGSGGTDFGAPEMPPAADSQPVNNADLERLMAILDACWYALETASETAEGRALRTGPRGGGRDREGILHHALGAAAGYLARIGQSPASTDNLPAEEAVRQMRAESLRLLARAVKEGIPTAGPRGGARWTARYFTRRSAWHLLDHAWEIEDRMIPE